MTKTYDGVEGCTQGEPGCTRVVEQTTLPPATVSGSFTCATPGANGWCVGGGALDLSASEPLAGYVITLIENDTGTLCDPPDAANVACTWDQGVDGSYTVEFWAHSSYGDTSAKGSAVWRQDAAGPESTFTNPLEGSTTPATGVVSLSGTSVDLVSGVAGAEMWVEGGGGWQPLEVVDGAWSTTWDTTTIPDGTYFVQVRAIDLAGNVGEPAEVFLEVDNEAPVGEPAPRATDEAHPHAIAEVERPGGTDSYSYDTSGSQTQRTEAGETYNQSIDAEGHLVSVQNTSTGEAWTFAYDGDGERIRQVNPDGTTTLFLAGGLYEVTLDARGQETGTKRYYAIGGQPIALRDAGGTFYLLTDHLGSVVTVLDGSGALVGEQRYRPFGQPRLTPGITQTDRGYTGQQSLSAAGLVDFNARWVDSSLGMFASPDSLISDPFDPQALSRYAYVFSNPLRYTDPSGHRPCEYDVDSCRPAPSPAALRGTTVHGGQTLAGGGMGSRVVTDAYRILNEDRQSSVTPDRSLWTTLPDGGASPDEGGASQTDLFGELVTKANVGVSLPPVQLPVVDFIWGTVQFSFTGGLTHGDPTFPLKLTNHSLDLGATSYSLDDFGFTAELPTEFEQVESLLGWDLSYPLAYPFAVSVTSTYESQLGGVTVFYQQSVDLRLRLDRMAAATALLVGAKYAPVALPMIGRSIVEHIRGTQPGILYP